MSGLLFLSLQDFKLQEVSIQENAPKKPVLQTNIKGMSIILFYSTACQHCDKLIPIFKNLPGTVTGCQFGILNVSTNKQIIEVSNRTILPIRYVPYIVMFIDGNPFMTYEGPYEAAPIRTFIIDISKQLQIKNPFLDNNKKVLNKKAFKVHAYTTGIPNSSVNVCYLDSGNCYENSKPNN